MVHPVLVAAMQICQISLVAVLVALEISLTPFLAAAMVVVALLSVLVVVIWELDSLSLWKRLLRVLQKLSRITDFLPVMTVMAPALVRVEKLKTAHAVTVRVRQFRSKIPSLVRCSLRLYVQSAKEQAKKQNMPVRPVMAREELLTMSVFLLKFLQAFILASQFLLPARARLASGVIPLVTSS